MYIFMFLAWPARRLARYSWLRRLWGPSWALRTLLLLGGGYFIAVSLGPRSLDELFRQTDAYGLIAQVLPVFLLAWALQTKSGSTGSKVIKLSDAQRSSEKRDPQTLLEEELLLDQLIERHSRGEELSDKEFWQMARIFDRKDRRKIIRNRARTHRFVLVIAGLTEMLCLGVVAAGGTMWIMGPVVAVGTVITITFLLSDLLQGREDAKLTSYLEEIAERGGEFGR